MKTQKFFTLMILAVLFGNYAIAQDMDTSVEETTYTTTEETVDEGEDEKKSLSFSGSVDAYYRANLTAKNNPSVSYPVPGTSFANGNGFSLGMFNLISAYEGEKAGIVADLVFGPRGEEAVFGSGPSTNIVNQLYAYWNVSESVTLTIGNFNTFLGYEVISPLDNFNYSTSYMFSYGPFSHTGLKADFGLTDELSLMLGVFNPTDMTETNILGSYTLGAQLGYSGESSSIYLNVLYGDQDGALDEDALEDGDLSSGATFQVDVTAGFDVSESLYVGVNTTYNSTSAGEIVSGTTISDVEADASDFYGFAAYLQYAASDALSLGLRGEYFGEANFGAGAIGAYDIEGDASVIALTLSGNIKVGDLTLIPELRLDSASEDTTFMDSKLAGSSSLASFLLAAVYGF
jgi:hypothetical protein